MKQEHFLDLVGAINLIPGPNSTEMTMHCGHERAGWKGLIVAGFCFIFPAVVITSVFAWIYQEYGQLPKFGCGLLGLGIYFFKKSTGNLKTFVPLILFQVADPSKIGILNIFLTFLKIGAILYGCGYVLFAFLDTELVANGWLTRQVLIDAVALIIAVSIEMAKDTLADWQTAFIAITSLVVVFVFKKLNMHL